MQSLFTATIPALNVFNFPRRGKVFVCVSATAAFNAQPGNEASMPMSAGRGFGNPNGREFGSLQLSNTSGSDITVTFYWGNEDFRPDVNLGSSASVIVTGATVRNIDTFATGGNAALLTLATGVTSSAISGTSGSDKRKQIIVSNHNKPVVDPNVDEPDVLYVLGSDDKILGPVYPQQSVAFESGGNIKIKNAGLTANTISYSYGEVWYDL